MKNARSVMKHCGRTLALASAIGAAIVASPAVAEVYKWTDERGVVNYTSTPPKARTAQKLDAEDSRLTVVPSSREELERAASTAQQLGRDRERRENASERSRMAAQAQAAPSARDEQVRAWRDRCINEKWADCDDERALFARYSTDPRYGPYGYRYGAVPVVPGPIVAGRAAVPPAVPGPGATPPQPFAPMARIGNGATAPAPAVAAPRAGTVRSGNNGNNNGR